MLSSSVQWNQWNLRGKAKKDLDPGVRLGIVQKVEQGRPQPSWISPAIFVEKSDGGCQSVVNYKALNKQCSREPNHTPDVLKLKNQMPSKLDSPTGVLFFSVLNVWNGYHSIRLTENARQFLGFSTEWGTYTYNVASQGYLGSGDYYTKKMDEAMDKIKKGHPLFFTNPCSLKNEHSTSWVHCHDNTVLWVDSLTKCIQQTFIFI